MIRKAMIACTAVLLFASGCATAQDAPAPQITPPPGPPPFQSAALGEGPWDYETAQASIHAEVLVRGLERPWGMVFLPEGGMLVTERVGRLRHIDAAGNLDPDPITGLPAMYTVGIAGLKGIALHPRFASNRLVYMAYSKIDPNDPSVSTLAVMRGRWEAGSHELTQVEDIFVANTWYGAMPLPERCCGQGPAFGSYGGRILFDADGYLFVSSGDRNWGERVQDPANQYGKIFRLNDDGSVPPGNPWVGREGHEPRTWSTGHRNPLGLTINPFTGELWESEFGPRGGDEVNRILRGGNYGWMSVTQGQHYNNEPAAGVRDVAGIIDPVLVFGPPSFNPGNLAFYAGEAFPDWNRDLLLASFTQGVLRYETDAMGSPVGEPEVLLRELGQRWRDVQVGPDGALYLLTDQVDGALVRVTPRG
ncbi:MAG: PQQ-dependent sugar dehydrogenase [Erythrobacter sp.]|nr:MAG: PQQ-dependent sugar dehydrogenase [Erythrobacter sp.]